MRKFNIFLLFLGLLSLSLLNLVATPVLAENSLSSTEASPSMEQSSHSPESTSILSDSTTIVQEISREWSTTEATGEEVKKELEMPEEVAEIEASKSLEEKSLYRLYHPDLRVHLYSKDSNEYQVLGGRGWKQEGEAWKVSMNKGDKVYRLYHPSLQIHLFTKDANEYRELFARGWQQEGEAFRSYGGMPIYRLYHPGIKRHLYTKDIGEYQILGKRGWQQEGVAFYGLGRSENQFPPHRGALAGKISIEKIDPQKGSFEILISGVSSPTEVSSILLPIWSADKGQDDVVWYEASPSSNGTYRVKVEARNHKYSRGIYYIHLYYKTPEGKLVFVTDSQHQVNIQQSKVEGKITIQHVDRQRGRVDIQVTDIFAPAGIKQVLLPVWTETNGQDDIRWYTATRQADGSYQLTLYIADHRFQSGLYHVHAYIKIPNGQDVGIGNQTFSMNFEGLRHNGNYYHIHGKHGYIPIINKKHPINPSYNPGENSTAKAAFNNLTQQMRALGFGISYSYSGFRSYTTQHRLYWAYVSQYGQAAADRFSARPGYSEHQSGLAFDILNTDGSLLTEPNAVSWLAHNAHKYGFVVRYQADKEWVTGYTAETWHIRFIGPEAPDIYHSGLSVEEYYGVAGGGY